MRSNLKRVYEFPTSLDQRIEIVEREIDRQTAFDCQPYEAWPWDHSRQQANGLFANNDQRSSADENRSKLGLLHFVKPAATCGGAPVSCGSNHPRPVPFPRVARAVSSCAETFASSCSAFAARRTYRSAACRAKAASLGLLISPAIARKFACRRRYAASTISALSFVDGPARALCAQCRIRGFFRSKMTNDLQQPPRACLVPNIGQQGGIKSPFSRLTCRLVF